MKTFAQFVNEMSAPVGYTCPDINKIQNMLADVETFLDKIERFSEDDKLVDELSDNRHTIKIVRERHLEDLRSCNSSLRDWGYEMEAKVDSLNEEISHSERKISDLENDIDYLTREISRLESLLASS